MASRRELEGYIRFQLEQLSVQNGFHEFENLCRHLARVSICPNIIPASGPVSAGGDQGRDFETFATFLGKGSTGEDIAFACTLQKDDVSAKVRSDITRITCGRHVDAVYVFLAADLEISKVHDLQEWANDTFQLRLEILNGQALSELLAEDRTFFLAVEFLKVPSEMYPRPLGIAGTRYEELRVSWRDREPVNYSDFIEVKWAGRQAIDEPSIRQDVPFWIGRLERLLEIGDVGLRRLAIYESAALSVRAGLTLRGQEDRLKDYFGHIPVLASPSEFEDSYVLLVWCLDAGRRGTCNLSEEELRHWYDQFLERLNHVLRGTTAPGAKCCLLEIRGFACSFPLASGTKETRIDACMTSWLELVKTAGGAHLFPLTRFTERVVALTRILGDHPQFQSLSSTTDALIAERLGQFAAAENCRKRAIEFIKMGCRLAAIKQLHDAKIKWFTSDTLRESLLCLLLISECYRELGLHFAAKYYALAAAVMADATENIELKPLLPQAIFSAALCSYTQGFWLDFLDLASLALEAHVAFGQTRSDKADHDVVDRTVYHAAVVRAVGESLAPALLTTIDGRIAKWPEGEELLGEVRALSATPESFKDRTEEELAKKFKEELCGYPFGDASDNRTIKFDALGVSWSVRAPNTYQGMLAVEGVAAALQIFLADVPPEDLCLVRGSTEITVESTTEEVVSIERKGRGREWVLKYPITTAKSADNATERQKRLAGCVCEVVGDFSLLKSERFLEVLDRLFGNGLREKLFAVSPYEEVLKEYSAEGNFARERVKVAQQPQHEFTAKVGLKELEWPDGPGPGYAPQLAKQHIDNRYRIYRESVRYTLQQLAKSSSFRATVNALRGKGWRDWHVLTAVSGIVLNRRAKTIAGEGSDPETVKKIYGELLSRPEREDDPLVPDSEFTVDKMKLLLEMSMLATLDTLGLCYPRREIIDFEQIADFLGKRYNYWNDDTPHQDLFSSK